MATMNSVNTSFSGQMGTGSFVGSTSPTLVTPTLGVASATSIAFSSTSGVIGTTTNDQAAVGSVGEVMLSSISSASAILITTGTPADSTSLSLTAGDWEVYANVGFRGNAATNVTFFSGWVSSTSATRPDPSLYASYTFKAAGILPFNAASFNFNVPKLRFSLSGTTTVYLSGLANFTVNICLIYGTLTARRIR